MAARGHAVEKGVPGSAMLVLQEFTPRELKASGEVGVKKE